MKKLLILGVSGLLGSNLALEAAERDHELLGLSRSQALPGASFPVQQLDLEQAGAARKLLEGSQPDAVLNCTALASLEACERDPQRAQRLNVQLPRELARACRDMGITLQQISTDAVFDGQRGNYAESDPVNPLSVYASTKWEGEEAVRSEYPQASIARVNFFGWSLSAERSLAEFFYNNLVAGQKMKGLVDRFFNPLHVTHLAQLLLQMLERGLSGTYHVASPLSMSKYEFGVAIAQRFGLDEGLIAEAKSADLGYEAARSPNLTISVHKLTQALDRELPDVHAGIDLLHQQHRSGYPQRLRAMAERQKEEA